MIRRVPPSQASAHVDVHCAPSGTIVVNFFVRISVPMRMPARRLPPLLLNSTVARPTGSDSVLARKVSMSARSNSPSTTTSDDPLSRGLTAICAASALVNASDQSAMIHTLRTGLSESCFVNADTFRLLTKPQAAHFLRKGYWQPHGEKNNSTPSPVDKSVQDGSMVRITLAMSDRFISPLLRARSPRNEAPRRRTNYVCSTRTATRAHTGVHPIPI